MVDAFCRDVAHLEHVLHNQIQGIDGVLAVTSYLITDIKYESNINITELLNGAAGTEGQKPAPGRRNPPR